MTHGRNMRNSTMIQGRQYATGANGTVITFECKRARHKYKIDFGKRPLHRRLDTRACKMMASWWSEAKGGCIGECPTCAKAERATKATT